ncbi:MAG: metallophosphoesterase [Alphaproteobacteria bacterium]|nr:metallophosphoesterase [Alphaproteobacteria bacterium]
MSRFKQIARFLAVFSLILGMTHYYLYQRIAYYLELGAGARVILGCGLACLAVATALGLPLTRSLPRWAATLVSWVVYLWMGVWFLLFIGFLATDILWLSLNLLFPHAIFEPSACLQEGFGIAAIGLTVGLSLYAVWNGLRPVRIRPVSVTLKKMSPELNGLRIAQITDLHIGSMLGDKWLGQVVDRVNALDVDVIAITGDLVDGSLQSLRRHVAPLGALRARHGVYFVTGNHEYYSGVTEWCDYIQSLGITVLRNQRKSIIINGKIIDIAGVDDWYSNHFPGEGHDLNAALAGRDTDAPVILLAHQPKAMDQAAQQGVDLQLSGHTHAGQIWPFNYLVYLQQPIHHGLFQHETSDLQVYVSAGTGFWGPPMRLGTSAEITHIILQSGKQGT